MNKRLTILSTRELDPLLVESLTDDNVVFDQVPFIEMIPRQEEGLAVTVNTLAGKNLLAVFTSRIAVNAVTAMLESVPSTWKIACMGGATRKLATDTFGEKAVVITSGTARELGEKLLAAPAGESLVFFAGNRRLDELPGLLKAGERDFEEVTVYDTIDTPVQVIEQYDAVLFFSPSAAHSFFSKNTVPVHTVLFSIGETTAAVLRKLSTNKLMVSPLHSPERMIETLRHYFSNKG